MIIRPLAALAGTFAFALGLAHCSSAQSGGSAVAPSASCPAAGTRVPYAQLLTQTRNFVGCDVETEVAFVGVGMGGTVGNSVAREGHSIFRSNPPGQGSASGPLSADFSFLTVPDALATPLFSASAGQRFVVRGVMEMQEYGSGYDFGSLGRILRASSVAPSPSP